MLRGRLFHVLHVQSASQEAMEVDDGHIEEAVVDIEEAIPDIVPSVPKVVATRHVVSELLGHDLNEERVAMRIELLVPRMADLHARHVVSEDIEDSKEIIVVIPLIIHILEDESKINPQFGDLL